MRHFQTLFLDFDGVIVQYLSLFQQFFREETDDVLLGNSRKYDPSINIFFQYCEQHNIRVVITSLSSREAIFQTLENIGVSEWYTRDIPIFGYRDIGYDKIHPDFWLKCVDKVGTIAGNILVIDDSRECILSAKNASLATCHYSHFYRGGQVLKNVSDYHAESFLDIIKVLSDNPSCNTSVSL